MRKLYITLVISFLVQSTIFSQTAPISFSLPTTKFCSGQIFPISFTNDPSLDGHTFQVQLSNSSGSFASGVSVLGSGTSSPISCTMISLSTTSSSLYKVRISDVTSPTNISNESATIINNTLSSSMIFYPIDTLGNSNFSTTLCTGSSLKLFTNTTLHDNYGAIYEWKNTTNPSIILSTQYKLIVNQAGNYQVKVSKNGCVSGTSPSTGVAYSSSISTFLPFPGELHCAGSTVSLKSSYNSESVVYEWRKDGAIIPNATFGKYDATTSGLYTLNIMDNTCQHSSSAPMVFGNNIPIQFSSLIDTIEVCNGSSTTLTVTANFVAGNTTEWFRNGQSISPNGQFLRTLTTPIAGVYTVKIKEGVCSSIASPIVIKTVTILNPKIKSSLETTNCVISSQLLSDIPSNFNGQIQWQKDGVNISSATSNIYFVPQSTSGSYRVNLAQGTCVGSSPSISITSVSDNPPYTIISTPILCSSGYKLSLLYSRATYSFVQYQWFKDGIAINGATSATYNAIISGVYKVRVSMTISSCVGFSQDLIVTINPSLGKPVIVIDNINKRRENPFQCSGNTVSIRTEDINQSPVGLIWKRDGVNLPTIFGVLSNVATATSTGVYTVSYTSGTCTVESNPIKINIGDKQQSIKTNTWNDASSWACGTVPILTDEVIINKGHIISLPNNYTGFLKNLELNGTLQKGNNAQLKFQTN
jgi:hypothetical protein